MRSNITNCQQNENCPFGYKSKNTQTNFGTYKRSMHMSNGPLIELAGDMEMEISQV